MEKEMEMERKSSRLLGGLALAALLALIALIALVPAARAQDKPAQDKPKEAGPDAAAMDAMMKAGTPGEHHKALGRYVGDWTYTSKVWMAPGQPPEESKGTAHAEWIMDGHYVRSIIKGEFGGMPFVGESTDGYDNVAKMFVSSWIDSASTGMMFATGSCDADHKVCTSSGDYFDPMTGKKTHSRSVVTWKSDDSYVMEMFNRDAAGQETKTMELTATKTKP